MATLETGEKRRREEVHGSFEISDNERSRGEKVAFRPAVAGDRASIAKMAIENHLSLSDDCPEEWLNQLKDVPDDFPHLLDASKWSSGHYYVATLRGKVVGSAGITPKDDGIWQLTAVTVVPRFRKRGIGKHLVEEAVEAAKGLEAQKVTLVTLLERMEPAWRLYEKVGFHKVKEELVRESPRPVTVLSYEMCFEDDELDEEDAKIVGSSDEDDSGAESEEASDESDSSETDKAVVLNPPPNQNVLVGDVP